jgi:GTP-binding protein HflX
VGFIHKLPHQLVDAFRATLEEVTRADILLEVVDAFDPHLIEHRQTVQSVLEDLGAGSKPRVVAYNKADLLDGAARDPEAPGRTISDGVLVSAKSGYGLDTLKARVASVLSDLWEDVDVAIPYAAGELIARVRERGTVEIGYRARDVRVQGRVVPSLAGELKAAAESWRAAGNGRHREEMEEIPT